MQPELHNIAFVFSDSEECKGPLAEQERRRLFNQVGLTPRIELLERRFAIERAACERLEREKRKLQACCLGLGFGALAGLLVALLEVLWWAR